MMHNQYTKAEFMTKTRVTVKTNYSRDNGGQSVTAVHGGMWNKEMC